MFLLYRAFWLFIAGGSSQLHDQEHEVTRKWEHALLAKIGIENEKNEVISAKIASNEAQFMILLRSLEVGGIPLESSFDWYSCPLIEAIQ